MGVAPNSGSGWAGCPLASVSCLCQQGRLALPRPGLIQEHSSQAGWWRARLTVSIVLCDQGTCRDPGTASARCSQAHGHW